MFKKKLPPAERKAVLDAAISLEEMRKLQLPQSLLALKEGPPDTAWVLGLNDYHHPDDFASWAGFGDRETMPVKELVGLALHAFFRSWVLFRTQQITDTIKARWCLWLCADLLNTFKSSVSDLFYRQCEFILKGKEAYLSQSLSLGYLNHLERRAAQLAADYTQFGNAMEADLACLVRAHCQTNPLDIFEATLAAFDTWNPKTSGYEKTIQIIQSSVN